MAALEKKEAEEATDGIPAAALVRVMQQVDLKLRLGTCVRVSKSWYTAAVAATSKVELLGCTQRKCTALEPWLRSRAAGVDSIIISARFDSRILAADAWLNTPDSTWRMPELLLPYQRLGGLTKLSLKLLKCPLAAAAAAMQLPPPGLRISSGSGSKVPASLAALTALKELSVTDCIINLQGLPALTALEWLELRQGWGGPQEPRSAAPAPASSTITGHMARAALPNLTNLTHLSLAGSCCCAEVFLHINHLENLEQLELGWAELPRPVVAGCESWSVGVTLDATTMPHLSKLTRLQKLVIAGAVEALDPVLLHGLPATMQHLQLDDVRLVMTLGQPRLAVLAGFKQLRYLSINNKRGPLSFLAPEDCVALTASSKLTYLGLSGCQMPTDGCSRMFAAECQLPFLVKLEAAPSILSDPAAVALLGICCPKLESLIIQLPTAASQRLVGPVNLSGLQQVSGLTQLVLTGATVSGSSGFRALGQLTGLQELVVSALRGFRLADVMQLTACKALKFVKLMHMQLTDVLAASLCLTHLGHEDRPPNVWLQLPPALLKQALWLYPFRSVPTAEEVQQVTELVNALQMHYLVEASSHNQLGPLQQQIINLSLALLQLQQQRQAVVAAIAGCGPHIFLQQLQQQTQSLREALMRRIADFQESIKAPAQLSRPQQGQLPAELAGFHHAAALRGMAVMSAQQLQQQLMLPGAMMGQSGSSLGVPLLQQQLLEATQASLAPQSSIAQMLLQQGQQYPLTSTMWGGGGGGVAGLNALGAVAGSSVHPHVQQQMLSSLQCNIHPALLQQQLQAGELSSPAMLLPLLQDQQQLLQGQVPAVSVGAVVSTPQVLTAHTNQVHNSPPPGLGAFSGPPPGLNPVGLNGSNKSQQQQQQEEEAACISPRTIAAMLTAQQQQISAGGGGYAGSMMMGFDQSQQQQPPAQQVLMMMANDLMTQQMMMMSPQTPNRQQLDMMQLHQQQQQQAQVQQPQLLQLQALAGLQNGMAGLML